MLALLANVCAQESEVRSLDDLVLLDLEKFEELSFRLDHPQQDGRHPVIIFSHQRDGDQNSEAALARDWARHGYICITPAHRDLPGDRGSLDSSEYSQNLQQRIADIQFILDSLEDIGRAILPTAISPDTTRVGLAGRDWGAPVVQILGGANLQNAGLSTPLASGDTRIRAFLLLDPADDYADLTLQPSSWNTFYRPLLVTTIAGRESTPRTHELARTPIINSPPGNKMLLWIKMDASSMPETLRASSPAMRSPLAPLSFQDTEETSIPLSSPQRAPTDIVSEHALLFWEAYLKGDSEAKQELSRSKSKSLNHLQVQIEFRQ